MADGIFQKMKALCGPSDKVADFKFVNDNDYFAVIRTKKYEGETEDNRKWCDDWMKKFGSATMTSWIVRYTYPSAQKYIYRKVFKCQHSSFDKVKQRKHANSRNRNKGCNATVNMLMKKINYHTIKNDNYLRNDGLNIVITISFKHNHSVNAAEAYSYLRMLPETETTFWGYFNAGMAPSAAKTYHEKVLRQENGANLELILVNAQINPNERQINYLHSKWRLNQEQAAQQKAFEEGQGSSSTVTQEVVTLPSVQVKLEEPDEFDHDFKERGMVYLDDYGQNLQEPHLDDPLMLKLESEEISAILHSIKEDVEYVTEATDLCETPNAGEDWRVTAEDIVETIGAQGIANDLAMKETIRSRWEQIVGNASKPEETVFVEPLVPDGGRKRKNAASSNRVLKRRPPDAPTLDSFDLCVLCAKDISRTRRKKSVAEFADVITALTGIDVTQYSTVMPNACAPCYRDATIVNNFKTKVVEASLLIKKKLPQNPNVQIETQKFNTDPAKLTQLKGPFYDIKTEPEDFEEMDITQLETEATSSAVTESLPDVLHEADFGRKTENGINPSTSQLKNNESESKEVEPKAACSICGRLYNNKNYYSHMQSHIGFTACKLCGDRVKFSYLRTHMRRHKEKSDDKFVCVVCGKLYYTIKTLRMHEVLHGEKKHKCKICNRSFHYLKYLRRHMRSHSGEKPYACTFCNKTFSKLWNLQQHRRLHTHCKPYKCRLCPATFRHNVSLKGHLVSVHAANELAADRVPCNVNESGQNNETSANSLHESTDNLGVPSNTGEDVTKSDLII